MTIWHLFQLSLLRLHSATVCRRLHLSLSLISTITILMAAAAAGLLLIFAAGSGGGPGEPERFWNEMIEQYLPAVTVIIIFWFVTLFQVRQTASTEQTLLNALPLPSGMQTGLGYLHTLSTSAWMQAGITLLYLLCVRTISATFTTRIIWLSTGIYITSGAAFMAAAQFSIPGGRKRKSSGIDNWFPSLVMTFLYLLLHVLLVAVSPFLTDFRHLFTGTLILLGSTAFLLTVAKRRLRQNRHRPAPAAAGGHYSRTSVGGSAFNRVPPAFLYARKNILFLMRNRKTVRTFFSGSLLITVVFSLVMNNQAAADRTALLLFIMVTIFVFLAVRGQSYLNTVNEPATLVYTLPVTGAMLYFGMSIPVYINGLCVSAVFAFMLIVTGSSPSAALRFLMLCGAAGAAVTNVAAIVAVKAFPDRKRAETTFWISAGIVSLPLIILYPYWLPLLLLWSVIHIFFLNDQIFYQTEDRLL